MFYGIDMEYSYIFPTFGLNMENILWNTINPKFDYYAFEWCYVLSNNVCHLGEGFLHIFIYL